MKKLVCYLVLDFDGVILPGEELMDNYVWDICQVASNRHKDQLFSRQIELIKMQQQLEEERSDDKSLEEIQSELNDIKQKISMHYVKKDEVLEETVPKYINRIPYKEIYVKENIYPGILELIHKINDMGIYVELIINTHVNSEAEIIAKRELLRKVFPPHKFIPVLFHLERYFAESGITMKRERSNKVARLIKALPYVSPLNNEGVVSYFVDNTESIVKEARALGFKAYFVEKNDDKYIKENPVLDPIPSQVIMKTANDTIDLLGCKVKKLSL